jgi:hypothetical protein
LSRDIRVAMERTVHVADDRDLDASGENGDQDRQAGSRQPTNSRLADAIQVHAARSPAIESLPSARMRRILNIGNPREELVRKSGNSGTA